MGNHTNKTANGTEQETSTVAIRRLLCFFSTLAALALSLAAADAMTGSLLDSIAVVTGVLAVRNPSHPMPPKSERLSRVRMVGRDGCRDPFVGVQNLN
jgi:hypothetical protein